MLLKHGRALIVALVAIFAVAPPAQAGTTTDIANNAVITGSIRISDDADEYRFDATARSRLRINVKANPGVFVDLGLSLIAPSGDLVDLTEAKTYRDRFRQIIVGGLTATETGTYRLFVTAAAPCAYTITLSTTPGPDFRSTLSLPPGGEIVLPVSAPAHSRLRITTMARARSRAHPRLMELGPFDLGQAGHIDRWRHRVWLRDCGDDLDFGLRLRDLSGFGGRVGVEVVIKAPKVALERVDTTHQTEIRSIVAGDGQVSLSWLPTLDATAYTVYWSNEPGVGYGDGQDPGQSPGSAITGITGTQFAHTGLVNGLTYYYAVTATCGQHGERERSREHRVTLPPDPPAGIVVTGGNGVAELTWNAAVGASSYHIYWSTEPGVTPATGTLIDDNVGTSYTHTGLLNGGSYHYVMTSVGDAGESEPSPGQSVTLAPDPPDVVSAAAGDALVTLSWSDSHGATSYNLYKGTTDPVTKADGTLLAGVVSPYADDAVENGRMYYYVVTAVGPGGESAASAQVAARPLPTPEAPPELTVTVTEESPGSLTISWAAPAVGADSYTLYWSTTPGVTVGSNPIPDVTSPYTATGLAGRTTYYYVVTSTLLGVESEPSAEVSGTPRGPPAGGGGGETGFGNNLSFPVVFADGYGITGERLGTEPTPWLDFATGMRPAATETLTEFPHFDPKSAIVRNTVTYYPQKAASTWQADWRDGSASEQEVTVDWGDNLRSQSFRTTSVVRVETTLLQDSAGADPEDTMTAYVMKSLEGSKRNEVQGTTGAIYESTVRTVYTVHARLRIQKLLGKGGAVDDSVAGINLAVTDKFGTDGPGTYGAEINVAGKLIYGYVWHLKDLGIGDTGKRGWWRITFELDPDVTISSQSVTRNTRLIALDAADAAGGASLDPLGWSSSVEIEVK